MLVYDQGQGSGPRGPLGILNYSRSRGHSWRNLGKVWSVKGSWESNICVLQYIFIAYYSAWNTVMSNKYLWKNMDKWINMTRTPTKNTKSNEDRQDGNQGVLLIVRRASRIKRQNLIARLYLDKNRHSVRNRNRSKPRVYTGCDSSHPY